MEPGFKREAVCCNVIAAAEHLHASEEVYLFGYQGTQIFFYLEREFQ